MGVPVLLSSYYERKTVFYWNDSEMIISKGETFAAMFILIINAGFNEYSTMKYSEVN